MAAKLGFRLARLAALSTALFTLVSAPGRAKDEPIRVAIFPVVNGSSDVDAAKIVEDILGIELRELPSERAYFLLPLDTDRVLSAHDALDRIATITNRWSKFGVLDSTAAAGLDSLLSVDAILLAKVSEWESVRVNQIGRGESNTTVALHFALYDPKTMKKIWSKDPREQRFAQEIDVSSGAVSYDETGYIQSRNVTDPPRYEIVTGELIRAAFKKFPLK